jgi:hypothetical protein
MFQENKAPDNGCSISFRQRLPDNPQKSTLYIAFTYPFSYIESCDLLKQIDIKFNSKINKANSKSLPSQLFKKGSRDLWSLQPLVSDSEVYYYRECLCYSLEGNRVELITISSHNGMAKDQREDRLTNLFPIAEEPRPFKFPNKKVVFLSARVHPGETPSSFVLNGFIKFILDKLDPRAIVLRRYFVFKIIPILNPDGVAKGHYRTDPRGVNLNRMYLNPSVNLHPSIYAARKLLIYYHNGVDAPDPDEQPEFPVENAVPSTSKESLFGETGTKSTKGKKGPTQLKSSRKRLEPSVSSCEGESQLKMQVEEDDEQFACGGTKSRSCQTRTKPYTFVLSDANSLCAGCGPFEDENASLSPASCSSSAGCLVKAEVEEEARDSLSLNDSVASSVHQCAFEACDEDSVFYENLRANNDLINMEVDPPTVGGEAACLPAIPNVPSEALNEGKKSSSSRSASPRYRILAFTDEM